VTPFLKVTAVMPFYKTLLLLLLGGFAGTTHSLAQMYIPPIAIPYMVEPHRSVPTYGDMAGSQVLVTLQEVKTQADHYGAQANRYSTGLFVIRLLALLSSLSAAIVLALSNAEWSRRVALLASIVAAALPVTEQIFQVGDMHRSAWRANVEAARLFNDCKSKWELASATIATPDRVKHAQSLITNCRADLAKVVDTAMNTSLKPIQLPNRIVPER